MILPTETAMFQPILDKLLAHDPKDRFKTAQLLLAALERIMAPIPTLPQEVAITGPKPKPVEIQQPRFELPLNYGQQPLHSSKQQSFLSQSRVKGISIIAILMLGLLVVILIYKVTGIETLPDQTEVNQLKTPAISPNPPKQNEDKIKQEITQLLLQAERQWQKNYLTQPNEDSAYDTYRKILELDAQHFEAQQGIRRIADHFEKKALHSNQSGQWTTSFVYVEQGLKIQPDHPGLQKLSREILSQTPSIKAKEKRRDQELARLLAQAERQFKKNYLTQPTASNAYKNYQKVLELDPMNIKAIQGIARIANHFEAKASQHKRNGAWRESLKNVEQGLKILPDHVGLRQLHQEVTKRLAAPTHQKEQSPQPEIAHWLEQAERQWKNNFLTYPVDDNAYSSYLKVLVLDANNIQAIQGIQRIANHFESMAEKSKQKGAWKDSLTFVEQGLKITPEHPGLLILLREVLKEKNSTEKSTTQKSVTDKKEEKIKVF